MLPATDKTNLAPDASRPWLGCGPWVWQLLVVAPIFLVLASCLAVWMVVRSNQDATLQQLMAQQEDETELLAKLMASKLEQSQKVLATVAEAAAPWMLDSKPSLEWLVEQGLPAARYFDSLVFAHGSQVFRLSFRAGADETAKEVEPAERDLLRRIMVDGKPQVSEPINSSIGGPSIAFGMPLRNNEGDVLGAMAGVLRLQSQNLLPVSLAMQPSDSSKLVVMTTAGVVISHPDPARIMGPAADEPALAQALQMWSQRAGSSRKAGPLAQWLPPHLISVAEIPSARWLVLRVVNRDKAIAGRHDTFWRGLWQVAAAVLIMLALMLAWLWWHTRRVRALATALPMPAPDVGRVDHRTPAGVDNPPLHGDELQRVAQQLQHLQGKAQKLERIAWQRERATDAVLEHAPLPILLLNRELISEASQSMAHLLGFSRTDLLGQPVQTLAMVHSDVNTLRLTLAPVLQRYGVAEASAVLRHQSGAPVPVSLQLVLVPEDSRDLVWCFVRPSAGKATGGASIGRIDKLTQLPNYDALFLHLTAMLQADDADAGASAKPVLFYVNVDNMSAINALAGHAQGDVVLQHVARQLQLLQPFQGFAARVAGDKFALVLRQCSAEKAHLLARQLCESIEQWQPELRGRQFVITVSVGLLEIGGHFSDAQEVIRTADMACYEAKRVGGNCARWSKSSVQAQE